MMRGSLRLQLLGWVLVRLAGLAAINAVTGYRTAKETADLVADPHAARLGPRHRRGDA